MKTKLKYYKPVRVVDPVANFHTTRVNPCQAIQVKLKHPHAVGLRYVDNKARFVVSLKSDLLFIEKVDKSDLGDIYTINQKYDLREWTDFGESFLGEVSIKIVGNEHAEAEKCQYACNVGIVLESKNDRVLTVVNPRGETIKVEPHQILEVVCHEPSWNDYEPGMGSASGLKDSWDAKVLTLYTGDKPLKLVKLRSDIAGDRSGVLDKDEGDFAILNRFHFTINPRLSPASKEVVENDMKAARQKPCREHHFWYGLDGTSLKAVADLKNGNFDLCTINFKGTCPSKDQVGDNLVELIDKYAERKVEVRLNVQGKKKTKMHPFHLNPDSVEHKLEQKKRSQDRGILTNPLMTEQIDFFPGFEEATVEIVQPSCLWEDLGDEARWEFSIDDGHLTPRFIEIVPLDIYWRWGKQFQRVKIKHNYTSKITNETKFLGALHITCPGKQEAHDGRKRISFWLTPTDKHKNKIPTVKQTSSSSTSSTSSSSYSSSNKNSPCGPTSKKKERDYRSPQVSVLKIEELETTSLEDLNTAHAPKTKKFSEVWGSSYNSYHQSNCMSEMDFYHQGSKKKEPSTSGSTTSQSSSTNESGAKKSEKSSETKNDSTISASKPWMISPNVGRNDGNGATATLIIYNPDHLQRMTLKVGQDLIVRMSRPGKVIHKCDNEFWSLSHNSLCDNMKVVFKTVIVGESHYQEARVSIDPIPPTEGVHAIGCLKFECSEETRCIFIEALGAESDQDAKTDWRMNIIQPARCWDGTDGRKVYISEFNHEDAVVVDPNLAVYVRHPVHTSEWSKWRFEIEQMPIPGNVLRHESLLSFVDNIDLKNPWFQTSQPMILSSTYVIRPLVVQQAHALAIFTAAADLYPDLEYLPIAKFTFRSDTHPRNSKVATQLGEFETKFSMGKTVGLCVPLAPYRRKEVVLQNPSDKAFVNISPNEVLVVKLTPMQMEIERHGVVESPWYLTHCPNFLDAYAPRKVSGKNEFRFRVRQGFDPAMEPIKFVIDSTEISILANYKK